MKEKLSGRKLLLKD